MSWSVYTAALPGQVTTRVNGLAPPGSGLPERDAQVAAAKTAALALINSGTIGAGEAFSITLTGHANPANKATGSAATDMIMVSVAQTSASAVTAFDQQQVANQANLQ